MTELIHPPNNLVGDFLVENGGNPWPYVCATFGTHTQEESEVVSLQANSSSVSKSAETFHDSGLFSKRFSVEILLLYLCNRVQEY